MLLLGAGYGSCTSFHLAEYRPPAPLVPDGRPAPGGRLTVPEVPVSSAGFEELGREFERERPVARGTVGAADARLFPVADAVAYAERRLASYRDFPDPAI